MTVEQVYTLAEVAQMLRISMTTAYRHVQEWPHLLIGGSIRFTESQYQTILAKATKTPAQPAPHTKYGTRARRNK